MSWNSKDVSASGVVIASTVNYVGFSARETSGAAVAHFRIRAGGVVTGEILERVQLSASESARECYVNPGYANGGLYFELVSGAANVSVRYS